MSFPNSKCLKSFFKKTVSLFFFVLSDCLLRSNANFLTDSQIQELQTGLVLFSKDRWQWNLKYFIMTYKFNLKNKEFIYDHNSNVFFHWIRLFLLNFEQLLQRKLNQPIGVPYWDWFTFDLPKLVKPKKFVDLSSKMKRNFFRGSTLKSLQIWNTKKNYNSDKHARRRSMFD